MADKTWRSCEDAARDLNSLNAFGSTPVEELVDALSRPTASESKDEEGECVKFVDPRTGDEICVTDSSPWDDENDESGRLTNDCNDFLSLQKQLRMVRPLGCSNRMIEHHFAKLRGDGDSGAGSASTKMGRGRASYFSGSAPDDASEFSPGR